MLGPPSKQARVEVEKKVKLQLPDSVDGNSNHMKSEAGDGVMSEAGDSVVSDDDGVASDAGDDVTSDAGDASDGVDSDACGVDGTIDPFKVHFESVLSENQVEQLAQTQTPTYTQSEVSVAPQHSSYPIKTKLCLIRIQYLAQWR